MSNLKINIIILMWHIQLSDNWEFTIVYNKLRNLKKDAWIKVFDFNLFK